MKLPHFIALGSSPDRNNHMVYSKTRFAASPLAESTAVWCFVCYNAALLSGFSLCPATAAAMK